MFAGKNAFIKLQPFVLCSRPNLRRVSRSLYTMSLKKESMILCHFAKKEQPVHLLQTGIPMAQLFYFHTAHAVPPLDAARTFFEGWFHGYIMWVAEIWFDALVVDCLWFCHSKKMIIPGTEDLVDAYHDYWHHIKYAVIGMFSQAVIALPVGLLVMWQ